MRLFLWTTNHSLRPETAAAGRIGIPKAVFLIGFGKLASAAGSAKREVEGLDPLPKGNIFGVLPQILEGPVHHVPYQISSRKPLPPVEIARMVAKKGHAGAEVPFPCDHRRAPFNERAEIHSFIEMNADITRRLAPPRGPVERLRRERRLLLLGDARPNRLSGVGRRQSADHPRSRSQYACCDDEAGSDRG